MDEIPYERGSFYIFDRGYNCFERLYRIHLLHSFFVLRARDNAQFRRIYSAAVDKNTGIRTDQTGVFTVWRSRQRYPSQIRKIRYVDIDTGKEFVFLTNNFSLQATQIALLYKHRWQIEIFFKWIKQHLKITSFWGHTENAVKTQIYCAVITYCLVSTLAKEIKSDHSVYEILQILGISLMDKTPIKELLTNTDYKNVKEPDYNLLLFN
jgi:IS4 transposase